jgi:type IV pilus assembly protein PilM
VFFARHKLPRKNVRIGIASNRIGVRIFDMIGIADDKQLANAIQFRAQEALPIPLDEAVLDYRVLDSFVNDEGTPVKKVLLVVAYRDLVERYINACKKAGIGLAGIDLEAFALLRSMVPPAERGNAATVAVAIGHDRSTFAVTDGQVCEFTRVLEWGGWSLNIALARALDTAPSEVERFKRGMSLDSNMVIEGLTPPQSVAALDAVRKQLQSFARELVSSLQFYQNQSGSLAIGSIVITGGTAHLPGLAIELEKLIGVRVVIGDPLARLKMSKRIEAPEPVGSLAVAIGLGIED